MSVPYHCRWPFSFQDQVIEALEEAEAFLAFDDKPYLGNRGHSTRMKIRNILIRIKAVAEMSRQRRARKPAFSVGEKNS